MTAVDTLTRCARVADVPAALAEAFRSMPHYMNDNDARDSYGEGTKWDPLSTQGGNRTPLYLTGWRIAGHTEKAVVYVLRFAANDSFGSRSVYAAYHLGGMLSLSDHGPTTRTAAEDAAQVYINKAEVIEAAQRELDADPRKAATKTVGYVTTAMHLVEDHYDSQRIVTTTTLHFRDGTTLSYGDGGGETFHQGDVTESAPCSHCQIHVYNVVSGDYPDGRWVADEGSEWCDDGTQEHTPARAADTKAA